MLRSASRMIPATKFWAMLCIAKRSEWERRLAEGEGFEPPVRFPAQRFSRPPP
jgi:hypothetical protein